uniref:Alpha-macroglobulin receptor-binding domain-containing protein n=1 Tax=Sphenodon punctatus TaxID=8508 RepID=A0A8D0GSH3_SPHPU
NQCLLRSQPSINFLLLLFYFYSASSVPGTVQSIVRQVPTPSKVSIGRDNDAFMRLRSCRSEAGDVHVYTKALVAYAFALARREEKRRALLDSLDKEAVKDVGSVHWQRPEKQQTDHLFYRPRAPSAEVEMTSYVLLAHLTGWPALSWADLTAASLIVRWLSKQQNPNGGFSSTQDTVVALQALALYGASTYSRSGMVATVTLRSRQDIQARFRIDDTNRLLLQRVALPPVPGEYGTQVAGQGCVYTQTSLRYNVHIQQGQAPFMLQVHAVPKTCAGASTHRTFDIAINVSYTGKRPASNMAIIDVKMLSGFIPVKSSVKKLQGQSQVKRTEVSTNHVLLYLEQVSNVTQSYSFTVEQDVSVQRLKPALVKVYDYYETGEWGARLLGSFPCSHKSGP